MAYRCKYGRRWCDGCGECEEPEEVEEAGDEDKELDERRIDREKDNREGR